MKRRKNKTTFFLAFALLAGGALLFSSKQWLSYPQSIRQAFFSIWPNIETPFANLTDSLREHYDLFFKRVSYQEEAKKLSHKNKELQTYLQYLESKVAEFEEYHRTLKTGDLFKDSNLIPARVFQENLSIALSQRTLLNSTDMNLPAGLPVINHDGVVGITKHGVVGRNNLTSVMNPNFKADVLIERTGQRAIWTGYQGISATLNLIDKTNIQMGDLVVTSGMNGTFPSGIPVGYIKHLEFSSSGLADKVKVNPIANIQALKFVQILAPKPHQKVSYRHE